MKLRVLLLSVVCFVATLSQSFADLRIVSAYFGRPDKNTNVKRAVENYVEHGIFSFRISGENLGAKEHRHKEDYLRVVYEVDGRRYTTDGVEGQIFTFQGVRNPVPNNFFGFPGRPVLPETASVRITNATSSTVSAFSVDRHGSWRWQAEIPPGRTSTEVGVIGFEWLLVNRAGAIVEKFVVNRGENRVTLAGSAPAPAPSTRYVALRIENNTLAPVTAYSVDQWQGWTWKGGLAPGTAYEANVPIGESWVISTSTGRILREFQTHSRIGIVRVAR